MISKSFGSPLRKLCACCDTRCSLKTGIISDSCLKQQPEPAVAMYLFLLIHFAPTQSFSGHNPFKKHSGGSVTERPGWILGRNVLPSLLQQVLLPLNQHALPFISWLWKATPPGFKIFCLTGFCFHFAEFYHFFQSRVQFKWYSLRLKEKGEGGERKSL